MAGTSTMTKGQLELFDLAMRFYNEAECPTPGEMGLMFQCLIMGEKVLLAKMVEMMCKEQNR